MPLKVTCKRCRNSVLVGCTAEAGTAVIPGCRCCRERHDHGEWANLAGVPCRPVNIEAPPGFQHVFAGALLLG
jgi:hypothetical protein